MILVDTCVWVDFFKGASRAAMLASHLEKNDVAVHPWIIGELSLGHLGRRRARILEDLDRLEKLPVISDSQVRVMIESHKLRGEGIGWVDAQLLASCMVSQVRLWTFDNSFHRICKKLVESDF